MFFQNYSKKGPAKASELFSVKELACAQETGSFCEKVLCGWLWLVARWTFAGSPLFQMRVIFG